MSRTPAPVRQRLALSALLVLSAASAAFCSHPTVRRHPAAPVAVVAAAKAVDQQNNVVATALYQQAVGISQAGDYSRANVLLTKALELRPGYADARTERRYAVSRMGEATAEAGRLSKTIQANSSDTHAYLKRGEAYYNMGRYEAALADFGQVIGHTPDCAEAYRLRCRVFAARGDEKQAYADFVVFTHILRGGKSHGEGAAVSSTGPAAANLPPEMNPDGKRERGRYPA